MPASVPWILLLYQLPARPSTQRVYVWRRLKACGVVYLQNSVCLVPDRKQTREQVSMLEGEIVARKGDAKVLSIRLGSAADDAAMKALFRKQSEQEYRELLGKCRDFHGQLKRTRAAEQNPEALAKIEASFAKIQQRDFFGASAHDAATAAIAKCQKDFARDRDVRATAAKRKRGVKARA
jgi:hypothetical protein